MRSTAPVRGFKLSSFQRPAITSWFISQVSDLGFDVNYSTFYDDTAQGGTIATGSRFP